MPVGSFFRRLLYGLHFREANFLLSDAVNDNSKLMYVRNPRDAGGAGGAVPDPRRRPVPGRGRRADPSGSSTATRPSATYPYSQRVDLQRGHSDDADRRRARSLLARQNVNYIRNSVKATVDAYDGTVTLYEFDETDPVLKAWNKAFGGDLIKPKAEIPAELAAHFRYPEDLFKVQRDLLAAVPRQRPERSSSPGQDFWEVPDDPAAPIQSASRQAAAVLPAHPVPRRSRPSGSS